jgi:hypothetical protein
MDYFDILLAKKLSGGGGGEIEVESLTATENGTYNAGTGKAYNPVVVAVPEPTLITKSISQNGTYNASDDNADGYSSVTVDVEGYQIKNIPNVPADIASFSDGTDLPMPSLVIGIEPVQSGSGEPSPENVRPISGWTGANVNNYKVYQICESTDNSYTSNGLTITYEGKGEYSVRGRMSSNASTTLSMNFTEFNIYDGEDSYIALNNTFSYISLYLYLQYGTTNIEQWAFTTNYRISSYAGMRGKDINKLTLVVPSTLYGTDIDFRFKIELYSNNNKHTYPITWSEAGTVYGGELDVTSGVLTVTHANIASYNGESINEPWISSEDAYESGATPTTGAQVVYPLTTPLTVQLTPTQIKSLLGQNNIWADSGQIISGQYFAEL